MHLLQNPIISFTAIYLTIIGYNDKHKSSQLLVCVPLKLPVGTHCRPTFVMNHSLLTLPKATMGANNFKLVPSLASSE